MYAGFQSDPIEKLRLHTW